MRRSNTRGAQPHIILLRLAERIFQHPKRPSRRTIIAKQLGCDQQRLPQPLRRDVVVIRLCHSPRKANSKAPLKPRNHQGVTR